MWILDGKSPNVGHHKFISILANRQLWKQEAWQRRAWLFTSTHDFNLPPWRAQQPRFNDMLTQLLWPKICSSRFLPSETICPSLVWKQLMSRLSWNNLLLLSWTKKSKRLSKMHWSATRTEIDTVKLSFVTSLFIIFFYHLSRSTFNFSLLFECWDHYSSFSQAMQTNEVFLLQVNFLSRDI